MGDEHGGKRLREARVPGAEIVSRLGRHRSRIYRELARNQTDTLSQDRYRAGLAGIGKLLRMLAMSITLKPCLLRSLNRRKSSSK